MSKPENGRSGFNQDKIVQRLHEAIDQLRKDATRVEVWAAALGSFAQPVPDYRPDDRFLLRKGSEKAPRTVPAKGPSKGSAKARFGVRWKS